MPPPPTKRTTVPRIVSSEKLRAELRAEGKVSAPPAKAEGADSDFSGLGSSDDEGADASGPVIIKAAPSQDDKPGPASSKRKANAGPRRDTPKKVKFDTAKGVLDTAIADQIVTKITGKAPPPSVLKQFEAGRLEDYGYLKPAGLDRPDPNPNSAEATDNSCGQCVNCRRKACQECSLCKRGDSASCIDRYCLNQRDGLAQRQAMKELYMLQRAQKAQSDSSSSGGPVSIKTEAGERSRKQEFVTRQDQSKGEKSPGASPIKSSNSISQDQAESDFEEELVDQVESIKDSDNMVFIVEDGRDFENEKSVSLEERVDKIMQDIKPGNVFEKKKQRLQKAEEEILQVMGPKRKKGVTPAEVARRGAYVYGASSSAKKLRRCGECEGCMREDCGRCESCKDKPRFGGTGKLKKACPQRKCEVVGTGKER